MSMDIFLWGCCEQQVIQDTQQVTHIQHSRVGVLYDFFSLTLPNPVDYANAFLQDKCDTNRFVQFLPTDSSYLALRPIVTNSFLMT